ncbi:MAG: hypothetical protein LC624_11060 [Halobacteriales archaeon]|nr:hypothetical protein [Halobacteriales archaeon]
MRPRVALAVASLCLLPAAGPLLTGPGAGLAPHSLDAQVPLQGLIDLAARTPPGFGATLPVLRDGAVAKLLHIASGQRTWDAWLVTGQATPLDLDGDRQAELRVGLDPKADLRLHLDGLRTTTQPWALWLDDGLGHWGVSGQGTPPRELSLELRDGAVRLAARGATTDWHAAFLGAPGHAQGIAWLLGGANPVLLAEAGHGMALHALTADSTLRALLLDGAAHADIVLSQAPAGGTLERDPDGGLRYDAPRGGGSLRYDGDASPIGQDGDLQLGAEPLPPELTLAPAPDGFRFDAAQPTDLGLDWGPIGAPPLHVRARDTGSLLGRATPAGLLFTGSGAVQAQQGDAQGSAQLDRGQALLLRAAGSPLFLVVPLALLGGGAWAWRARKKKAAA